MNDSELRILEIIDKKIDGLREDMRDSRTEFQTQFMRHDASDNERFAELFQRLRPLEIAAGIQEHMEQQETETEHRKDGWAVARVGAFAAVLGGVGGEMLHWFFAFFTQRAPS
jgi:hypothetical protein